MDDQTVRLALQRHWEASDRSDFEAEHDIYHDDAVLDYPQSGERIRGRRNIQQSRTVQPNTKRFAVRRMIGADPALRSGSDGRVASLAGARSLGSARNSSSDSDVCRLLPDKPRRARRFHRAFVSFTILDSDNLASIAAGTRTRRSAFVAAEYPRRCVTGGNHDRAYQADSPSLRLIHAWVARCCCQSVNRLTLYPAEKISSRLCSSAWKAKRKPARRRSSRTCALRRACMTTSRPGRRDRAILDLFSRVVRRRRMSKRRCAWRITG